MDDPPEVKNIVPPPHQHLPQVEHKENSGAAGNLKIVSKPTSWFEIYLNKLWHRQRETMRYKTLRLQIFDLLMGIF